MGIYELRLCWNFLLLFFWWDHLSVVGGVKMMMMMKFNEIFFFEMWIGLKEMMRLCNFLMKFHIIRFTLIPFFLLLLVKWLKKIPKKISPKNDFFARSVTNEWLKQLFFSILQLTREFRSAIVIFNYFYGENFIN